MIREAVDHLDSKVSHHTDSAAKMNVSVEEMRQFFSHDNNRGHSSAQAAKFLDMGSADDLYGSGDSSKSARNSGRGADASVNQMADQQFDLGKAVQDWATSVVDAGRHALEGLGKEAPKATFPEAAEPTEKFKPFNPKTHGTPENWTADTFEKWLTNNIDNEEIIVYPRDEEPYMNIDPGFKLPMDKKGAPQIDPGFKIQSGRTTRKVVKDDDPSVALAGSSKNDDISAILAGSH